MNFRFVTSMAVASVALAGFIGCKNAADCNSVCNRYQECFDEDYDVEECVDRCVDQASNDEYAARLNECDACLVERDCVDSAFNCAGECGDIVP